MTYFSERELGPRPRINEQISEAAWGGIIALIESRIGDGSLGYRYPAACPDGNGPYGCDRQTFFMALQGEVPDVTLPLRIDAMPPTLAILDLVEFCYRAIAKPVEVDYHSFFNHSHLRFIPDEGRAAFKEDIERIFSRNGLAYQLNDNGSIERLAPQGVREILKTAEFRTGDKDLDSLLESARAKYLDPDLNVRKESLEKLWDAWERLKTIEDKDKRRGATILLDKTATEPTFRGLLEEEAEKLTAIGNNFRIRHSETTKAPIESSEQVDYLFHRMFSFIRLTLKKTNRGG